ncbi:hypothetical protein ACFYXM_10955 [Streptomyces sp. NPDC002476]|uniref:hypothetical protein n=1 Tax=Streptomyces sp. NPDC002476 TaxID=3364648 RepID=UPI0036CEFD95
MVTAEVARSDSVSWLAVQLAKPVGEVLAVRAAGVRALLPSRPDSASGRYMWWRCLSMEQARQAMILGRLEALSLHLRGIPALGYAADDLLPLEAVEEAEGFVDGPLAEALAHYRACRERARSTPAPLEDQVSCTVSSTGRRP